jgi:hypothetical protein
MSLYECETRNARKLREGVVSHVINFLSCPGRRFLSHTGRRKQCEVKEKECKSKQKRVKKRETVTNCKLQIEKGHKQ